MVARFRNRIKYIGLGSLIFVFLMTGVLAVPALAVHFSLDTDDGQIDLHWYPSPYIRDPEGDVTNTAYDIIGGWIEVDSNNPHEFYFRMRLSSPMLQEGVVTARLDCNQNDRFDEIEDKIVDYDFTADTVIVSDAKQDGGQEEFFDETYGEWIAPVDYEWKAVVTTGDAQKPDWTECLSAPIQIRFETYQNGESGLQLMDSTSNRSFDAPAAVTLVKLQAHTTRIQHFLLLLVLAFLYLTIIIKALHRFRSQ